MVDATHTSYPAGDRSYFSLLKKDIHHKAQQAGFNAGRLAELDLVLAELTSNLHKYANDGEILVSVGQDALGDYMEIIAIDNGPGMVDPAKMMQDGYSTGSSMGHGLGSISRMSDVFDLYSVKGWGSIILSRLYQSPPDVKKLPLHNLEIKPLVVAKTGETVSGDGTYYKTEGNKVKMLVADGLGHGVEANVAVNEAVKCFETCPHELPVDILRYLHQGIRKTRGMVGTVVTFDVEAKKLQIAGIGNIAAKLLHLGGDVKNQISYNGIIGHNIPNTMNNQQYNFADYSYLILCSDGIKSRLDLNKYQGIGRYDAAVLAAAIYKDFSRRTDDTSVVIVKLR
ncbi:SpoIIE family protein phosphatase [Mucilaginibacter sp. PAMB04168]|uniref:SpoIIE family protein phosphatase n=1 Tax=Mucilaginibacter sp. PAMB04168 TaxID=3138567 RepID=UPI0031F6014B